MKKRSPKKKVNNLLEQELLSRGYKRIIGIDEVGRGAFAGPVYVAGFIYTPETPFLEDVDDSKKLSPKRRLTLFPLISEYEHTIKIGDLDMINSAGIGKTIENLITEIVLEFDSSETYFLVDGYFKNNFHSKRNNLLQIKGGDRLHYSISCASVIAKVMRDSYMQKLGKRLPQYGFDKNVGYGTATHIQAITEFGITKHHRTSFRPLSQMSLPDE